MSTHDKETQRNALLRKLRALVDCVVAQSDKDPAFADKLAHILLGDTTADAPASNKTGASPRQTFNPVLFLKDHGEVALRRELEGQTDDDLRAVLRFQRLRTSKDLKKLGRAEMMQDIVTGAQAKLKQGMVVAQMGETEVPERPPEEATITTPRRAPEGGAPDQ